MRPGEKQIKDCVCYVTSIVSAYHTGVNDKDRLSTMQWAVLIERYIGYYFQQFLLEVYICTSKLNILS